MAIILDDVATNRHKKKIYPSKKNGLIPSHMFLQKKQATKEMLSKPPWISRDETTAFGRKHLQDEYTSSILTVRPKFKKLFP